MCVKSENAPKCTGRPLLETEVRVPRRGTGADQPVRAKKSRNGDGAKGLNRSALAAGQQETGGTGSSRAKPFRISKKLVWEAYKKVKANKGADAGCHSELATAQP